MLKYCVVAYAFAELIDNALAATVDNMGPRNIEMRLVSCAKHENYGNYKFCGGSINFNERHKCEHSVFVYDLIQRN